MGPAVVGVLEGLEVADDAVAVNSGSAYVFRFDGATWNEELKLVPSDNDINDFFGVDVAVKSSQ